MAGLPATGRVMCNCTDCGAAGGPVLLLLSELQCSAAPAGRLQARCGRLPDPHCRHTGAAPGLQWRSGLTYHCTTHTASPTQIGGNLLKSYLMYCFAFILVQSEGLPSPYI